MLMGLPFEEVAYRYAYYYTVEPLVMDSSRKGQCINYFFIKGVLKTPRFFLVLEIMH